MNDWLAHPDNEPPETVAARFGMSEQWACEHVGPHRCVDGKRYTYSCLVSDPAMDKVARWYTDLPPTNGRTLVEFECCGRTIQNYLRPSDPRICLDCRAEADREANGWTPENSRD